MVEAAAYVCVEDIDDGVEDIADAGAGDAPDLRVTDNTICDSEKEAY